MPSHPDLVKRSRALTEARDVGKVLISPHHSSQEVGEARAEGCAAMLRFRGEMEAARSERAYLRLAVTEALAETKAAREEVRGYSVDVEGVRPEVEGLRTEVEGLRADVGGVRPEVEGLRAELEGLRAEVERGRVEAERARAESTRVLTQLEVLRGEVERETARHLEHKFGTGDGSGRGGASPCGEKPEPRVGAGRFDLLGDDGRVYRGASTCEELTSWGLRDEPPSLQLAEEGEGEEVVRPASRSAHGELLTHTSPHPLTHHARPAA